MAAPVRTLKPVYSVQNPCLNTQKLNEKRGWAKTFKHCGTEWVSEHLREDTEWGGSGPCGSSVVSWRQCLCQLRAPSRTPIISRQSRLTRIYSRLTAALPLHHLPRFYPFLVTTITPWRVPCLQEVRTRGKLCYVLYLRTWPGSCLPALLCWAVRFSAPARCLPRPAEQPVHSVQLPPFFKIIFT